MSNLTGVNKNFTTNCILLAIHKQLNLYLP